VKPWVRRFAGGFRHARLLVIFQKSNMNPEDPLDRLHRDLKLKRLNPLWAKLEIVLGLFAVGVALAVAVQLGARPEKEVPEWAWLGPVLLITFGGYLALAGHRSHLYQSNNRLATHLADLIRSHQPQKPEKPS
jgi:hypothetical protein